MYVYTIYVCRYAFKLNVYGMYSRKNKNTNFLSTHLFATKLLATKEITISTALQVVILTRGLLFFRK